MYTNLNFIAGINYSYLIYIYPEGIYLESIAIKTRIIYIF